MINLDQALSHWVHAKPWDKPLPNWDPPSAHSVGDYVARAHGLNVDWEPPDEEWVRVWGPTNAAAMISTLFPLAFTTRQLRETLASASDQLVLIEVTDFGAEELQASPDLLRSTLLRYGWDSDFDTNRFCASDLFVVSV